MDIEAHQLVFDPDRAFKVAVDEFLREAPEYAEDLEQVFFSWNNIEEAVRRAAFFVSPALPSGENETRPLIRQALRNGVLASQRLAGYQTYAPFLKAFFRTLAEGIAGMFIYGLSVDGKQERWELCGANMCQWAALFDTVMILRNEGVRETDLRATEMLLSARILTAADLALHLEQIEQARQSLTRHGL